MNASDRVVARLRAYLRDHPQMSEAEIARQAKMSPAWVNQVMHGKIGKTFATLDKLAAVMGVDVADLLRDPVAPDAVPTDGVVDDGGKIDTVAATQSHGGKFRAEDSDVEYDAFERSLHLAMHAIYKEHGREGIWPVKDAIDEVLRHGPKASRRELRDGAQTK